MTCMLWCSCICCGGESVVSNVEKLHDSDEWWAHFTRHWRQCITRVHSTLNIIAIRRCIQSHMAALLARALRDCSYVLMTVELLIYSLPCHDFQVDAHKAESLLAHTLHLWLGATEVQRQQLLHSYCNPELLVECQRNEQVHFHISLCLSTKYL